MVGKLDPKRKHRWPDHISSVCHSYNATRSQVMGYSPHFLMFGRTPHLPIDLLFPTVRQDTIKGVDKYVSALYEHLKRATSLARATADKEAERFKRIYDRRAGAVALRPGDKVLIRIDAFVGARRKLKNRWSSQIHMVVCRVAEGVLTYVVQSDSGVEQVCHREHLLLWIAADADMNNGMRSNSAITAHVANGPVDGDNHEGKVVPQDLDYGLSLAMFRTVIGPHHHKTYRFAEAPLSGVVQKGVGQETSGVEDRPPMTGDTVTMEDVPP